MCLGRLVDGDPANVDPFAVGNYRDVRAKEFLFPQDARAGTLLRRSVRAMSMEFRSSHVSRRRAGEDKLPSIDEYGAAATPAPP